MSETVVPLWKQELLKRRERNARLSKKENIDRSSEASSARSNSLITNHRPVSLGDTRNNSETRPHRALEQKVNSESHRLISEDVDGFATRQRSGFEDPWRKNDMSSRLNRCNETSSKPTKHEKTRKGTDSTTNTVTRENSSDSSRLGSQYCEDQVRVSSITLDDSDKERLKALVDKTRGVDDEHIRPKDLKRMWKEQESKKESYPEAKNSIKTQPKKVSPVNHISKAGLSEFHHKEVTPLVENSTGSLQGNAGVTQSKIPKAYKSPYAKQGWVIPSKSIGKSHEKNESQLSCKTIDCVDRKREPGRCDPVQGISKSQPADNVLKKTERGGPLGSKSVSVEDLSCNKVEDDHIPSVKSLLGLFGGKATAGVWQKHQGQKTGRQSNNTDVATRRIASAPRKPALARHHSEPNLYSATEDSSYSLRTTLHQNTTNSQSEVDSKEQPSKPVALPSHHVSSGIEKRMSQLRRTSSTSMEEQQISFETTKDPIARDQVSDDLTQQADSRDDHTMSREISKREAEQRGEDQNSSSEINGDDNLVEEKININLNKVENSHDKPSHVGKMDQEKKSSPVYINGDTLSHVTNSVSNSDEGKKNHCSTELAKNEENEKPPKQTFDKLLSMFGPRASKKSSSIVTDSKVPKSHGKSLNKQNNYIVEGSQSHSGLEDQLPSTKHSNGISQNQQENKMVIKIEEHSHETEKRAVEKPKRRSLLNVEDPLDVLQLTKDPILLKGKQVTPDATFVKQTETGRKPTVQIIKSEPDKKDKIAKINRDWDLNHVKPSLPSSQVSHQAMPSNTSPKPTSKSKTQSKNVPVTSIDDIPVSSIDDTKNYTKSSKTVDSDTNEVRVGNTTFYDGTVTSSTIDDKAENENKDEFIPVSSIDDDDSTLPPPPEIIHDKIPEKLKSCFMNSNTGERKGTVSFFQNVFIHDYQCESAAAADWDFENGMAFSSYQPVAVRQYAEIDMTDSGPVTPISSMDMPQHDQPKNEEPETEEPNLIYNEEDSMGFTESSDSTAGALLF